MYLQNTFLYFVFHKILYKIHVQNFAVAKNFFSNNMVQTLARLMFNKFKQDCFDIKATASRMIHLTVHFHEESLSVLRH